MPEYESTDSEHETVELTPTPKAAIHALQKVSQRSLEPAIAKTRSLKKNAPKVPRIKKGKKWVTPEQMHHLINQINGNLDEKVQEKRNREAEYLKVVAARAEAVVKKKAEKSSRLDRAKAQISGNGRKGSSAKSQSGAPDKEKTPAKASSADRKNQKKRRVSFK